MARGSVGVSLVLLVQSVGTFVSSCLWQLEQLLKYIILAISVPFVKLQLTYINLQWQFAMLTNVSHSGCIILLTSDYTPHNPLTSSSFAMVTTGLEVPFLLAALKLATKIIPIPLIGAHSMATKLQEGRE